MLFPVDNEARQMKELNGIWKFKRDNYYKQGFEEKWFEKPLEDVIDMPVPSSYNDITTDQELRDHVGWVWYERKFAVPRLWKDQEACTTIWKCDASCCNISERKRNYSP